MPFEIIFTDDLEDIPKLKNPFLKKGWLKATKASFDYSLEIVKVFKEKELVLFTVLQVQKRGPFNRAFLPVLSFYGGPERVGVKRKYFDEELRISNRIIDALLEALESRFDHVDFVPDQMDIRVASKRNWRVAPMHYAETNLKKPFELSSDTMRMIRKSKKNGIEIKREICGKDFGRAYKRTFDSQNLPLPYPVEWVETFKNNLTGEGCLENWVAIVDDQKKPGQEKEIAWASVIPNPKAEVLLLWYACSLEEADKLGAMYGLFYSLMDTYSDEYKYLDLGGVQTQSLAFFKEHFSHRINVKHNLSWFKNKKTELAFKSFTKVRELFR